MDMSIPWLNPPTTFQIPGNPETDEYLLPVSGGADSAALALLLHELAPHINFRMIFTDTGAEEATTLAMLDRLEEWLQRPIERLKNKGLFDLIRSYNGFLPSPTERWCTRELKLVPFRDWIAQFAGKKKWMFVGIRADEADRLAFTIDEVETVMPFVEMGINREWVYRKMAATIGISASYRTRTRSGCISCPYQRTSELVGLLQRSPAEFDVGASCEKLSATDLARHDPGVPLWRDTGISANWCSLPMPESDSEIRRGGTKNSKVPDLFGARVFIGGEFFMDGLLRPDEFAWHQRVVCFSSTLAGAKKQLDGRYQHLLSTAEVHGMTADEMREKARFAIWYIELPSDVFDPTGISRSEEEPSYTWNEGKSYRQIRHVVEWATRVLNAEFERRLAATTPPILSPQYEWSESARETLAEAKEPVGSVLVSQWYQPSEKAVEPETEEEVLRLTPCPMCHI